MSQKKRVIVFSDFESIRSVIVKSLIKKGYAVVEVKTYSEAMVQLNGTSFGLLITDYDIKDNKGVELLEYMRNLTSYLYTPVLLMHSRKKEQLVEQLGELNIAYYINKPFDMQTFFAIVERLT